MRATVGRSETIPQTGCEEPAEGAEEYSAASGLPMVGCYGVNRDELRTVVIISAVLSPLPQAAES